MNQPHVVNILVVDNQLENLLLTEEILNHSGYQIIKASSGQEALNYLNQWEFAVIILDVKMPVMDGFETARRIRENPKAYHTPIIFMTGYDSDDLQIVQGYHLGCVDYLIKPISPQILRSKVAIFAQLHEQQAQLKQQAIELETLNQQLQKQVRECHLIETKLEVFNEKLEETIKERNQKLTSVNKRLKQKIREYHKLQKEQRKTEQKICSSELLYRTILHSISDGVFITDEQGNFTFICLNANIIFGYSVLELQEIGNITTLLNKDFLADVNDPKLTEISNLEHCIFDKLGRQHFLLISIKKITIGQGTLLFSCRDITDRKQTELILHQSQEKLRNIVNNTSDGLIVVDQEGIVKFINPMAEQLFGLSQDELLGNYLGILSGKQGTEVQIHQTNDQSIITEMRVRDILWDNLSASLATFRDITERKQIEEELRENEVKFRQLAENIRDVFFIHDAKTYQILYVSPAFETIWEIPCEVLYQDSLAWFTSVHPEDQEKVRKKINNEKQAQESTIEYRIIKPKGQICWVRVRTFPVFDQLGQFIRIIGVAEDITERIENLHALWESEQRLKALNDDLELKIAERTENLAQTNQKLRQEILEREKAELALLDSQKIIEASEAQLRAIFDYAATGILLKTLEGKIIKANQAIIEMLGYPLSELLKMDFLALTHPDDLAVELQIFQELINGHRNSYQLEKRYLCANGKIMWGHLSISLINNNQGNPAFILGVVEDVSEQVALQEEMQKALDKERELNQFKSHFIDVVSHEFRTPLTSILGYTELLINYADKFSKDKREKHLNHIKIAGDRMKTLIDDVLCLSRMDAGKLYYDPEPLDVISFCQDLIEELQIGVGKDHDLQLFYTLPPVETTYLDEKLLRHILSNLLTNSIKYSPQHSQIELGIEWHSQEVIFFIKDQGIGIPFADQIHLFDSFHRAGNIGNIPGTGLGLNIVKRYVELHQGSIIFSSMINEGTTFRIALPIFF